MKDKKLFIFPVFFAFLCSSVFSAPLYSPTWGFKIDLPEGYYLTGGDGKDRYSFANADGALFDLIVYYAADGRTAPYAGVEALAQDVERRLNNSGDTDTFEYRQKKAVIMELTFANQVSGGRPVPMAGWALCLELGETSTAQSGGSTGIRPAARPQTQPLLLAMAYGPESRQDLMALHFSALDSIAPKQDDSFAPGPITEYSYPRETQIEASVFGLGINASIYEEDAEAAQALVDREFQILRRYQNAPNWQEAWIRFYRAIYRDSFDRLANIAFKVERKLNIPPKETRDFADQALQWVQSFNYERDFMGSDFVNLVSAATEGRGDCDSRALLWAIILKQANIQSAIMVSRNYSHAMGLADISGTGARFEVEGQKLLVAETTARVSIGLIGETVSDIEHWLGITFD
ncbi:MAG: hypothetical protein FWH35_02720 [Treponema sp.]|nr:hypothetical protein [Treponema sp.]